MNHLPEQLPEEIVEALANGREDLVDETILAALPEREAWKAQIAEARALAIDIGLLMRDAEMPALDLDAMVSEAIARQPVAPSRRSLWIASGLGLSATLGLAVAAFSDVRIPTPSDVFKVAGLAVTFFGAVDAMVQALPGGWGMLALGLAAVLAVLAVPARVLARGGVRVAGVLLVAFAAFGSPVSAQTFTGDWPSDDTSVSLSVDDEPVRDALRSAAEEAEVNLVLHETPDRNVSLHVDDASLRDVMGALLVDTDLTVHRSGNMVVVRTAPAQPEAAQEAEPSQPDSFYNPWRATGFPTPPVPAVQPTPATPVVPPVPPTPSGGFPERTTFGDDIRVGHGETVHSVFTMGGDAEILGRVIDNVVSMGGDVVVRSGGIVGGDVMTTGGDLEVEPGGVVQGRVATLGGEVSLAEGASAAQWQPAPYQQARVESLGQRMVGAGAGFGLLFLLGLVLVGSMSERHTHLVRAIVKQPIRSGMTGILGAIGTAIVTVVLIITVIGIPGAIVVGLGGFVGVYAGMAVAASVLGAALPIAILKNRPVAQLGAGVAILYVAWIFPFGIGRLVVLLLALLGFGAILLTRFGKRDIVAP